MQSDKMHGALLPYSQILVTPMPDSHHGIMTCFFCDQYFIDFQQGERGGGVWCGVTDILRIIIQQ